MSEQPSGWAVGWTAFAGFLLIIIGAFHAIAGFVGILEDEFYVGTNGIVNEDTKWVFQFDATTWGWVHLILGILVVLVGLGLFSGNVVARTVAVILAAISAIANFMWLPYYPIWSIVIIAIDIAVIWALTSHGRDIAAE